MIDEIDWYTHPTGDPFADVGGYVIEYLQEKMPDKSMMDLIAFATDIYVNKWDNNLHSFFLNSTITHNSNKGKKGYDKTILFYKTMLLSADKNIGIWKWEKDKWDLVSAENGVCRITSQKGSVFYAARDNHIMSGSATLINFHHGFETGLQLSKEALIRIFFVPLGVEKLGDKVAILTSNKSEITRYFVRQNVDNNYNNLKGNFSKSINNSEFANPVNGIFNYAEQCIQNVKTATFDQKTEKSDTANTTLNLFHFTNFGASPTINILTLPAKVFSFYTYCVLQYKKDWNNFIFRQYRNSKFKNAVYDSSSELWINNKEQVGFENYKTWRNRALEFLLNGVHDGFRKLVLYHSKKEFFNFNIIQIYQTEIRNMDKRTLAKILQLADFIIADTSDDDIKKAITRINRQKSSNALRRFLIALIADYNKKHSDREKPLITMEEYAEHLFPDGTYWNEIRDLLLIAIYQRLHEMNKTVDVDLEEEVDADLTN
jgi:CRISPR-associated protein Cst1